MPVQSCPVQQSQTFLTDLVFPPDTNHHNTIFGGKVMAYVDKIACIAAMRHCSDAALPQARRNSV